MSINGGVDKEDVVHIYSGILLHYKKEWNNAMCRDMDGHLQRYGWTWRLLHWGKSDRERQISYGITYTWNLKKWYKWTYLQNRSWVTDIENKYGKGRGKNKLGDWDWHIHATVNRITNENLLNSSGNSIQYLIMAYMGAESKNE